METPTGDMPELELAILRRSLGGLADAVEHCDGCQRAMLIGERVYEYDSGEIRCALCRDRERRAPSASHTVHTDAHGNSIRILDRRGAKHAA